LLVITTLEKIYLHLWQSSKQLVEYFGIVHAALLRIKSQLISPVHLYRLDGRVSIGEILETRPNTRFRVEMDHLTVRVQERRDCL
jgi:DNA-binding Xre family transcriptional regulator